MRDRDFEHSVFVNCPFDKEYDHILQAVLYCLIRFGLKPRIASERMDAGEARLEKISELVARSKYSIHDLSRCQAKEVGEHYRLNMPFELGLDFGCRNFGEADHRGKKILILEEQQFRYRAAISELAGSDIEAHRGDFQIAVRKVRNWLVDAGGFESIGAARILSEYEDFQEWYYERQLEAGFSEDDIQDYPTSELLQAMLNWVSQGRPRK